ncbi:AAA+-type ATPase, SpoVK/Ycf46/Vps4 family [Evansella caseinilytica]|uniref:AAA+-type ATPase, SpoVK/Ycf46/Vps4 family n=1 Tax=Evansella caseinilytica TaxID=1503961 RepID=A0A1H3V0E8_9BACI|nr:AAA family ATPase [Evansella caseinilytica]SDZ68134.1 AAA+-type ATPase, SpoVK/Ycf46/Vps4 family [Evansella caseinilytica]
MNGENTRNTSLEEKIAEWRRKPYETWREQELTRALAELDNARLHDDERTDMDKIRARLLAMAAVARSHRKQSMDEKVQQRIDAAWSNAADDLFVAELVVYLIAVSLPLSFFQAAFPRVRETDHSQGRKKSIAGAVEMMSGAAEKTQQWLVRIKEYEKAAKALQNEKAAAAGKQGRMLLQQLDELLIMARQAAADYEASISGIYFSKEKHNAFTACLQELEQLNAQWKAWRSQLNENSDGEIDALKALDAMVGLAEVKEKVHRYYHYLFYQRERSKHGFHLKTEQSLNMILTGNPGTGKTALARLLAKIYHQLGVLPREDIVEVNRSHLVGAYVGQTEEKTMAVIQEAVGGVLFIDEAYSLSRENAGGNDYGQTAVDTLVAALTSEEYAGRLAVVLAGYPEEMRRFLWSNPGLRSRFPESNQIHLPDYSVDELVEIAEHVALENDFTLTADAINELRERIEREKVDESFGNARAVTNIVMDAIFQKGALSGEAKQWTKENFTVLDKHSFQQPRSPGDSEGKSGEEQLRELIGLERVKEKVNMLTSFVRIQKMRKEQGLPVIPVQLHSIFTGPPGTGKTTVARLYGKILNELGLLKRGHLVVAGRSDFVAGYVGQTAIKTKRKIKEALGGVLFIDEAYSLYTKGEQDFGKEAVDTLVEEMTKHQENLVVILAGYSEPIQELIDSNPGLASRFKHTVSFSAYTTEELIEILLLYVKKFGYEVDEETVVKLREAMETARPDGNGRAMKNLVEEAVQRQAYRLVQLEKTNAGRALTILELDDFLI